ncbi:MAG: Mur ligase family protein, partial [Eubacterium sp.]
YKTKSGKEAVIATSLGMITTANSESLSKSPETALLKLVLYKDEDGKITAIPSYIPCMKYGNYHGNKFGAIPTLEHFNGGISNNKLNSITASAKAKLGNDVAMNSERYVTASTYSKKQLSVREIYEALGQELPDELKNTMDVDEKMGPIVMRKGALCKDCIAIVQENVANRESRPYYSKSCITNQEAIDAGAAMLITDTPTEFQPSIVVDTANKANKDIIMYIRKMYSPKVICITGTVGKTTTKDMVGSVMEAYYNTLYVHGNLNTTRSMIEVMSKLDKDTEYWVQEVHGGTINHAASYSYLAKPDACMITNIGLGHLGQFNNDFDALVKGKLDIFKYLRKGGVVFLNYDNETLRKQVIDKYKVISYSTEDSSCDYYARNIKNLGDAFEFEIMDNGIAHKARVNVQGIHNVNNAVGAYAVARWAGVPSNIIISAIAAFKTEGVRQNLVNCGGYNLLVDCYSSQPSSIISGAQAIANYPVEEGASRVLVMSDLAYDLGENIEQIHRDMGKELAGIKIDKIITYGTYTKALNEEARKGGIECIETDDVTQFQRNIIENVKPKDIILFKGSSRNIYLEKY